MGNGLTTQNDDIPANQRADMARHRAGTQGQDAIGRDRCPTGDELPVIEPNLAPRLVQPDTATPPGSLANIINGHNVPADNAPTSCIATIEGSDRPAS